MHTRGVAQPGRASALGAECHQFESGYPDKKVAPHRGATFLFVRQFELTSSIKIVESEANKTILSLDLNEVQASP